MHQVVISRAVIDFVPKVIGSSRQHNNVTQVYTGQ